MTLKSWQVVQALHKDCTRDDGTLNSTQVANKFKNELKNVREYARSDVRRNGEAVVLNLRSKVWSFDVVPCFYTAKENNGRQYYLIPNGNGNWKKTDPTWDKERVTTANQGKDGRLLNWCVSAKMESSQAKPFNPILLAGNACCELCRIAI